MAVPTSEACLIAPDTTVQQGCIIGKKLTTLCGAKWTNIYFQVLDPLLVHNRTDGCLENSEKEKTRTGSILNCLHCRRSHTNNETKYAATWVRTKRCLSVDLLVLKADSYHTRLTEVTCYERWEVRTDMVIRRQATEIRERDEAAIRTLKRVLPEYETRPL